MSYLSPALSRSLQRGLWRGAVALACFLTLITGPAIHSGSAAPAAGASAPTAGRSPSVAGASTLSAPSQELPRSSPESQGIASRDILGFVQAADQRVDMMNSFMLVRHGH